MENVIECIGLSKHYKEVHALKNLNISIPDCGGIVGLLGPNGSGKTTFIKLLTGLLTPTSGEVKVAGMPIGAETKAIVSYLSDTHALNAHYTIEQELEYFKQTIGYNQIVEEIEQDVELMKTNPKKLDEKFGIVRDEYGREISRNGVPNPYYKPMEEVKKENEYFESIKGDPEKLKEYFINLTEQCHKEIMAEEEKTSQIAAQRLEEIAKNPTANFFETQHTIQPLSQNNTEETLEQ